VRKSRELGAKLYRGPMEIENGLSMFQIGKREKGIDVD